MPSAAVVVRPTLASLGELDTTSVALALADVNGVLGRAYMTAITPFRYLIVYPRMLKGVGRKWLSYSGDRS